MAASTSDLRNKLKRLMSKADIPGLSAAYIDSDGKITPCVAGTVCAGAEPLIKVTAETVFQAASLSKPVFAYLVLKLANSPEYQDKFNLDTEFGDLLPVSSGGDPNMQSMTARMILSHQTTASTKDNPAYAYSGMAYGYLQRVIEHVTKKSLEDLAKTYVFGLPIDMPHSTFVRPNPDEVTIALPHDDAMKPQTLPGIGPAHAAMSLYTTASDYARFLHTWMTDETLASAFDPVIYMMHDSWARAEKISEETQERVAWGLGVGLQITNRESKDKEIIVFHWGDVGDSKAFFAVNLRDKTGIVYFANSWNALSIARDMLAMVDIKLNHGFEFLCNKYGYTHHDETGWRSRQNRQTVALHVKHEQEGSIDKLSDRLKQYLGLETVKLSTHPQVNTLFNTATDTKDSSVSATATNLVY